MIAQVVPAPSTSLRLRSFGAIPAASGGLAVSTDTLATVSKAATQLAAITSIPEVLDIRNKAEAIRRYTKAAGHGLLAQTMQRGSKQWPSGGPVRS